MWDISRLESHSTKMQFQGRIASHRPTEALASIISFAFAVYSHHKHSKYLGKELNHGPIASVISFIWLPP